jgi:hypothetical protein|tara:strand:+ start:2425 stop:3024 length:600 start_codon:yes stop_codon:yes gene_type:complete
MRSIVNFIITPLTERYENEIRVDDKKLIVNASIEEFEFISRFAKVVAVPTAYQTNINVGDIVVVHHNIFRRWYDQTGAERNSASYFNEELYFAAPDQIYLFNQNDEWKTFGEYCFIKPLKDRDLTGVIKFNNNQLKEKGLKQGDIIGYPPGREWRFLIDEELLYCMKSKNISVKYENQGNEIEYNPRWAKGGGRINKGC